MAPMPKTATISPSDEALLHEIASGSASSFNTLVLRHTKLFYRAAYRITLNREDAEDVVQDAFLKLVDGRAVWKENQGAQFTTWFYRIVCNLALSKTRRLRFFSEVSDEVPDAEALPDEVLAQKQRRDFANRVLAKLPARQRTALMLHYYSDLPQKDAAAAMGVKIKAYESLLSRAKIQLKKEADFHG
jgi:RNA polymerase sigma-70 factor (ECF subfamily)